MVVLVYNFIWRNTCIWFLEHNETKKIAVDSEKVTETSMIPPLYFHVYSKVSIVSCSLKKQWFKQKYLFIQGSILSFFLYGVDFFHLIILLIENISPKNYSDDVQ